MKLKAKKPEVLKIPSLVETAPIDRRNQKKTFNENDDDILIENVSTKEKKDRSKNKVNAAIHKVTEESDDENAPEVINAADASLEQLRQLHQIINIPKKKRKVSKKDADIDISKPIDIDDSIFAVTSDLNEEEDMAPPILAARKIIKPKTHKKM